MLWLVLVTNCIGINDCPFLIYLPESLNSGPELHNWYDATGAVFEVEVTRLHRSSVNESVGFF
jgi:hypothetical protein